MWKHLSAERLIEAVEGAATDRALAHLDECGHCRARLGQARDGLHLAQEAGVPEPSPFYWEAFRRQVGRRIDRQEPVLGRWQLGPALAAAVVLVALISFVPGAGRGPAPEGPGTRVLPAWKPLPASEDDAGFNVLRALGPSAEALGLSAECRGLADCVANLSDEESQALGEVLRLEMHGSDS